jgi:group I intron endonuclease
MKTTNVSGIYIIKNTIDERVYVGSAVSLSHRKGTHFYQLKNNKHANKHLQNFYKKYGFNSLIFNVLEFCKKEVLIEREQYYFSRYNSKFNIVKYAGSTLGRKCPEHVKLKISNSLKKAELKGIKKSDETKKKMRKPKSTSHILKIKQAQKDVIKTVYQYTLNLELINVFESVSFAAKYLEIDRRQISANCNEKQKTCKGFVFKFKKI